MKDIHDVVETVTGITLSLFMVLVSVIAIYSIFHISMALYSDVKNRVTLIELIQDRPKNQERVVIMDCNKIRGK